MPTRSAWHQYCQDLRAYGALIEILQSFTTFRSADWHDLLADGLGLLLGWLITRSGEKRTEG